jgi:hypothetical protein
MASSRRHLKFARQQLHAQALKIHGFENICYKHLTGQQSTALRRFVQQSQYAIQFTKCQYPDRPIWKAAASGMMTASQQCCASTVLHVPANQARIPTLLLNCKRCHIPPDSRHDSLRTKEWKLIQTRVSKAPSETCDMHSMQPRPTKLQLCKKIIISGRTNAIQTLCSMRSN